MSILYPHYIFHRIYDIPESFFEDMGVTTLLLDVDNTLTHDNHPEPDAEVLLWLEHKRERGMRLMILSNNSAARVEPFARKLGMGYIAAAAKPLPMNLKKALRQMKVKTGETAIVGDQIFTDVLCGRLCGCTAVLVEPMAMESNKYFKIKRNLEVPVLRGFRKREAKG